MKHVKQNYNNVRNYKEQNAGLCRKTIPRLCKGKFFGAASLNDACSKVHPSHNSIFHAATEIVLKVFGKYVLKTSILFAKVWY